MRDEIHTATKAAMKSGDKRRLGTLRLISAAIKDRDIAARVDSKGQATGDGEISDEAVLQLLQKMVKQRREALATYQDAGRDDLVAQEMSEIAVIEEFLPKQMSRDEMDTAISALVSELGASGIKDMGKVMAELKRRYTGRMDFGQASTAVKQKLG